MNFFGFKIRKTFYRRVVCEVQRRLWRFDGKKSALDDLWCETMVKVIDLLAPARPVALRLMFRQAEHTLFANSQSAQMSLPQSNEVLANAKRRFILYLDSRRLGCIFVLQRAIKKQAMPLQTYNPRWLELVSCFYLPRSTHRKIPPEAEDLQHFAMFGEHDRA